MAKFRIPLSLLIVFCSLSRVVEGQSWQVFRRVVVHFPETWKGVPCADPQLTCRLDQGVIDFELKQARDDSHALLFQLTNGLGVFSTQRFAVVPGSGVAVFATSSQWENSRCLERQQSFNFSKDEGAMPIGSAFYEHGGRRLLKSGEEWGNILYNHDGGIAVLFSYTPRGGLLESIASGKPETGTFYIDVYETSTGRRLFRQNAPYQGRAITLSQGAFLFGDRYLITPLDPSYQSILVVTLPVAPVPSLAPPVKSGEIGMQRSSCLNGPVARITELQDEPVDTDGNGLMEGLSITAHVQVNWAGKYEFRVAIRSEPNQGMSFTTARADLPNGEQRISAVIPIEDLERLRSHGRYRIASAALFRSGFAENYPLDVRTEVPLGRLYRDEDFDARRSLDLNFDGDHHPLPIRKHTSVVRLSLEWLDEDENGKYEAARVVLVVKSRRPGQCSFALKLSADEHRPLQEWEENHAVKVGLNYFYHHAPAGLIQGASILQITRESCTMGLANDDTRTVHQFSATRPTHLEQRE